MTTTDDNEHGGTVPTYHNFKLKYIEVLNISVATIDENRRGGTVPTHHNFNLKYI